jgi:hypothetical protein
MSGTAVLWRYYRVDSNLMEFVFFFQVNHQIQLEALKVASSLS